MVCVCVCLKMGYTHLYGICLFRNMMLKTSRFRDPMAPWDTLFAGLAHPWCSVVFRGKNISNLPLHGSQVNIPITSKYHEIPSSLVNMNYMRYVSDCTSGLYHNMLQQHGWGFPAFRRNATSLASPSKKWKRGCFLRAAGSGWGRGLGRPSNSQPSGAGEKPHCRGAQSHGTRCHTSRSYPPHRPAQKMAEWSSQWSSTQTAWWDARKVNWESSSFGGDLLVCWKPLGHQPFCLEMSHLAKLGLFPAGIRTYLHPNSLGHRVKCCNWKPSEMRWWNPLLWLSFCISGAFLLVTSTPSKQVLFDVGPCTN